MTMKRWRSQRVFLRPLGLPADHEAALAAWAQWCGRNRGGTCELALSGHWLITCAAPLEQALAQWDHYLGLGKTTLEQAWVSRSVVTPALRLSCAAPRPLIDGLQKVAREHAVTLRWVGPWWAPEAQRWLSSLAEGPKASPSDEQTLLATEPGLRTTLKVGFDEKGQAGLQQVWAEACDADCALGKVSPTQAGATLIQQDVPPEASVSTWSRPPTRAWQSRWADELDFVGPRVRVALWSWALLTMGMAACLAMADQAQEVRGAQDEAQAVLHRLERARHQQTVARAAPRAASTPGSSSYQALDEASLRQAVQVAQWLAYPWPAVIGRVEQSARQEQAVLTGFSLDINSLGVKTEVRPTVRLQAAMRDDASALRWVAAHGDGAQILGRSALTPPFDVTQGHYALRVEASWPAGEQP